MKSSKVILLVLMGAVLASSCARFSGREDRWEVMVPGIPEDLAGFVEKAKRARGLRPLFGVGDPTGDRDIASFVLDRMRANPDWSLAAEDAAAENIRLGEPRLFSYCHWPRQKGWPASLTFIGLIYNVYPEPRFPAADTDVVAWVWFTDGRPVSYHLDTYNYRADANYHALPAFYLLKRSWRTILISNNSGWCGADAYGTRNRIISAFDRTQKLASFGAREGNMADFYFAVSPREGVLWAIINQDPVVDYVPELTEFVDNCGVPVIFVRTTGHARRDEPVQEHPLLPGARVWSQEVDEQAGTCTRVISGVWSETWDLRNRRLLDSAPAVPFAVITDIRETLGQGGLPREVGTGP